MTKSGAYSILAAAATLAGASTLLLGWLLGWSIATDWGGPVTMKPATAAGLTCVGAALLLGRARAEARAVAMGVSAHAVLAMGISAILAVAAGLGLMPDPGPAFSAGDAGEESVAPGVPSWGTILSIGGLGAAILEKLARPRPASPLVVSVAVALIAAIALVGHAFESPALYWRASWSTAMAIHTAVGLGCASGAIMIWPERESTS